MFLKLDHIFSQQHRKRNQAQSPPEQLQNNSRIVHRLSVNALATMHSKTVLPTIVPLLDVVAADPVAAPAAESATQLEKRQNVCPGWCGGGTVCPVVTGYVRAVDNLPKHRHSAGGIAMAHAASVPGLAARNGRGSTQHGCHAGVMEGLTKNEGM
jgi:hypothetical protein